MNYWTKTNQRKTTLFNIILESKVVSISLANIFCKVVICGWMHSALKQGITSLRSLCAISPPHGSSTLTPQQQGQKEQSHTLCIQRQPPGSIVTKESGGQGVQTGHGMTKSMAGPIWARGSSVEGEQEVLSRRAPQLFRKQHSIKAVDLWVHS